MMIVAMTIDIVSIGHLIVKTACILRELLRAPQVHRPLTTEELAS